ncbi:peptide deformylase [Methylococcus capsulatus]|uniref:peptide deformylase n=1 Tax=Methylococcus capsulatus TaxID=414 RepID=UPI003D277704
MDGLALRLKIVQAGEPVLRQRARPLSPEEIRSAAVQALIGHMRETMRDAPGVGLAAPQIGQGLQLAVIEDRADYHRGLSAEELAARGREPVPFHVIVNPEIVARSEETDVFHEGCLSLAGFSARVERARWVRVSCLDHRGNRRPSRLAAGMPASCSTRSTTCTGGSTSTAWTHAVSLPSPTTSVTATSKPADSNGGLPSRQHYHNGTWNRGQLRPGGGAGVEAMG